MSTCPACSTNMVNDSKGVKTPNLELRSYMQEAQIDTLRSSI